MKHRMRLILLSSFLLYLTGCKTHQEKFEELPTISSSVVFSEEGQQSIDKMLDALNLPMLIEMQKLAMVGNPDLGQLQARIQQASAILKQRGASLRPSADLGASAQKSKGWDPSYDNNTYGLSAGLSWEIDLWGKLAKQRDSAIAAEQAAESDMHGLRLSLLSNISQIYFKTIALNQDKSLIQQQSELEENNLKLARALFRAGDLNGSEVRARQSALLNLEDQKIQLHNQYEAYRLTLEELCGLEPGEFKDLMPEEKTLPLVSQIPETGIPAELIQRRPDLIASSQRLNQQILLKQSSELDLWPSLSINPSISTTGSQLSNLLDTWVMGLSAQLGLPIYQNRINAARDLAEANLLLQIESHRSALLNALFEVEASLNKSLMLSQKKVIIEEKLKIARENASILRKKYLTGEGRLMTTQIAEVEVNRLQRQLLSNASELWSSRFQLLQSLGWAPTVLSLKPFNPELSTSLP